MNPSLALLTIGQTPRNDIVPELTCWLPDTIQVEEFGALDGQAEEEIQRLRPEASDHRLITRLGDGRQVVVRKSWIARQLQDMLDEIDPEDYLAVILLCTGEFSDLHFGGLFLDAQHLVDHGTDAICAGAHRIGVLVPLIEQSQEFHYMPSPDQELRFAAASPYEGDELAGAAQALSDCDVIVMHCMGYTETQRTALSASTGKPVLLARRLVGAGMAQIV